MGDVHVTVVGAGVMGVHSALLLCRRGAQVTLLEREAASGGVWRYFANDGSRVQVPEPGYRLIPERTLTNFTEKGEVLDALADGIDMIRAAGGRVIFGANVLRVQRTETDVQIDYEMIGKTELLV